jgi:DNA gyrase inhibitor GyrI
LTRFFFLIDNTAMPGKDLLHVGITNLSPVQVAHKLCVFPASPNRPYNKIHKTFQFLREWVVGFGLDPDTLLHIGIPSLDGKVLVTYGCCIEFPLPFDDKEHGVNVKSLPGGAYAVLRIDKEPGKISNALRQFHGDYTEENQIIIDDNRPIYEIYYKDTMEYCVPVIK